MENNKKKIIVILSVIILLTVILGLVYRLAIKDKVLADEPVSYTNPILSKDGGFLAYLKYHFSGGDTLQTEKAEICTVNFRHKHKKKLAFATLRPKEEMRLTAIGDEYIDFEKSNYETGEKTLCRISSETGKLLWSSGEKNDGHFQELKQENGEKTVVIFNPPYDFENFEQASISWSEAGGAAKTIMEGSNDISLFTSPSFMGENILFIHKFFNGESWQNYLIGYHTKTGEKRTLSENCTNYLTGNGRIAIASRLSGTNSKKDFWEITVKTLSDGGTDTLVARENFEEEIFLYEWAASILLFQKGQSLCSYDFNTGKITEIASERSDGWWSYPLSPYYIAVSPDHSRLAILSYKETGDKRYKECIILSDINGGNKKLIFEKELSAFGKNPPFKSEFYKHILWTEGDYPLIFESKNPQEPETTRIIALKEDGSGKKYITGGFLSSF